MDVSLTTLALVAVVPKEKLTVKGPVKSYAGKGTSGKAVHRVFCSECGSPIAHDPEAAPPIIAIKAGTLDAEIKKTLKPVSISIPTSRCMLTVGRIPRYGQSPNCPSARSTWLSRSNTCPSN